MHGMYLTLSSIINKEKQGVRKEQRNVIFINGCKNCLYKVGRTMYDKRENYKGELHIREKHFIAEDLRVSHFHH